MANTIFRLTASKADTPISGDNPSANPTSTPSGGSSAGKPGTGYGTAVSKDIINTVSSPIVSGTFLFIGFILLLALIIKIKKNKQAAFDAGLNKNRYTTRILGFATFLALIAGIGGTAARFIGAKADTEVDSLSTSETVYARYIEPGDGYKLYCGTDQLSINSAAAPYGYFILMHNTDNTTLPSTTSGVANITSAEDWNGLGIGQWGYFVGTIEDRTSTTSNPLPFNYGVVANEVEQTLTTTVPVTFCAKVSSNIEASFTTTINYELLPAEEGDIYPEIDFNSEDDEDFDGLSNREENRYGMNPLSADSDMDSLSDYDELKVHHTDPLAEDTDEDDLADYSEVALSNDENQNYNFDPNTPDYNGETLEYTEPASETTSIAYTVTGTGDIPLTYIDAVNPTDIDESLENLGGTAYTFQSAGEVDSATITVPFVTEATAGEGEDDDTLGAVEVSDSNITDEDVFAIAMTFDDSDEEAETVQSSIADADKTIDQTNNTISINLSDSQAILFVGDGGINGQDDDTLGASGLGSAIKSAFNKVKTAVQTVVTKVKNFLTGGTGGGGTETWSVSSGFKMGRDSFNIMNPAGWYDNEGTYDNEQDRYWGGDGSCHGMAHLARLLYMEKIDLDNPKHWNYSTDSDRGRVVDGTFSLVGLTKDDILHNTELLTGDSKHPGFFALGKQGRAIFALFNMSTNGPVVYEQFSDTESNPDPMLSEIEKNHKGHNGPEDFIKTIKDRIDKNSYDDPIVISIHNKNKGSGHAVNAISLKQTSVNKSGTKKFELVVYDNNYTKNSKKWGMECSKVLCTVKATTSIIGSVAPVYEYYVDDDYYLHDYYIYDEQSE